MRAHERPLITIALLVAASCESPTPASSRGSARDHLELAPNPATAPPPAPQVLLHRPADAAPTSPARAPEGVAAPSQSSAPASPMSETERRRMLIDPNPPAPWPPHAPAPAVQDLGVSEVVYRRSYVPPYDGCGSTYCGPSPWVVPHVALSTIAGAVIGHQYHEKGEGAAIGLAFGLLTAPWYWCGGHCGDY